tara:strand:+ start:42 stop:461 length:420 start_codon:yes stop_codon:yes gene_type:complete
MSDSNDINSGLLEVDNTGFCVKNFNIFYFFNLFWIKFVQTLKFFLKTVIVIVLIGLLTYGTSNYVNKKNTNIFVFVTVLIAISFVISAMGAYDKNLYYAVLIGLCIGLGKDIIALFDIFKQAANNGNGVSNPATTAATA